MCPNCHQPVQPGATFCDQCGATLSGAPAGGGFAPAPQQQFPPPGAPVGGGNTCPNCGTPFVPGTAFCDNCGAQLPVGGVGVSPMTPPQHPFPAPQPPQQFPPQQFPPQQFPPQQSAVGAPPPMAARLMVGGQSISVPQKAEVILGRGDVASNVFPDVDLTPYGASPQTGVSRKHARLIYQGAWMIEDLNSTNGTRVRGTQIPAGQRTPVNNGDALTIGTLQLTFYTS